MTLIFDKALEHINSVTPAEVSRYSDYLRRITPVDYITKFRRWIFWDRKMGYSDSRYWSIVLEGCAT